MANKNNQRRDREEGPPPYSAGKDKEAAPEYSAEDLSGSSEVTKSIYRPFPAFIQATSKWAINREAFRTFKLCGQDDNDLSYLVEANLGFKSGGLIDDRPGIILHNGTSAQSPVIAAVCYESVESLSFVDFDIQSIILPPKLPNQSGGPIRKDLAESRMLPRMTPGKNIALRFSVEVTEKARGEEFEWRKCRQNGLTGPSGFKLYRASSKSATQSIAGGSSKQKDDPNVLAAVTWARVFSTKLYSKWSSRGKV